MEEAGDYVDNIEGIITSDHDMLEVDRLVALFEVTSGAILNRSTKTKVMGLGEWKDRTSWPLEWISTVKSNMLKHDEKIARMVGSIGLAASSGK